jgi:membrane-bound lytic murein transglycosylase D
MKRFILIATIIGITFGGCAVHKESMKEDSFTSKSSPQNIYLPENIRASVDSLHRFYDHAMQSLQFGDTIGARIYFEQGFAIISNIDEETKSTLLEWAEYDSLIKNINNRYEEIFDQEIFDQEAEEVREELTQIEEDAFGDSTLLLREELEEDTVKNLIPLPVNRRVELALKYFQTRGRNVFTKWLERSGKYEHLIKPLLKEKGLPENLFYLAMIESGFNPRAYSYARASGMWQFIYATGKYYGLRANWWFDERKDPLLSTEAAAEHLLDLYERFGDWYLALAGYNCNPRKVERRMRQYSTRDFWKLKRLPRQTRNYIPTFIAANIIAETPKKYGFYVNKILPVRHDTVRISECVDLQIVADCVDTTFQAIKDLNPAVLRWCTPPGIQNFVLNLPPGTTAKFREEYKKIPDSKKRSWVRHKVRSGETLSQISEKYHTSISIIKSYNRIRGTLIRVGQHLVIPVPQNKNYYASYRYVPPKKSRKKVSKITHVPGHAKTMYTVKKGDTIGEIAEVYRTRASKIRAWNGLRYGQYIYPNQKLAIWIPQNLFPVSPPQTHISNNSSYHIVKSGDTLWDISRIYNVSIKDIKSWNNIRSNKIKPGERLIIKESSGG